LCEPLFNARQTGLDKQQAVQEKPALLACYREGINAHLMAAIAMAEERPGGLLMPNQSLLYTGRVLACSQLNRALLNASMLVFHLPISRFLSYGITPRPMAGPVGRCDGMLQFTGRTSRNRSCPRGWCWEPGDPALISLPGPAWLAHLKPSPC